MFCSEMHDLMFMSTFNLTVICCYFAIITFENVILFQNKVGITFLPETATSSLTQLADSL